MDQTEKTENDASNDKDATSDNALDTSHQARRYENDTNQSPAVAATSTDDKITDHQNPSELDNLKSLDAALDNLCVQVTDLLSETPTDAPLDDAMSHLNAEVMDLLKESRKIQDELHERSSTPPKTRPTAEQSSETLAHGDSDHMPPHPLNTYQWEEIRRDKKKGRYPWTYLNPQENYEQRQNEIKQNTQNNALHPLQPDLQPQATSSTDLQILEDAPIEPKHLARLLDPNKQSDFFVFNYDGQTAIDSYSSKGSVKNSSSGILEVLHTLETDDAQPIEQARHLSSPPAAHSYQDLSTECPKARENKRFAFKSLLKRTHSAPKQIGVAKKRNEVNKQPSFCHSIVEKLKNNCLNEKHASSKPQKQRKPATIKTTHLAANNKIVLAEQTRIIRLKDSPKADRSKTACYSEKDNNDDVLEIIMLDESPGELRKRRDRPRTDQKQCAEHTSSEGLAEKTAREPTADDLHEKHKVSPAPSPTHNAKEHIYEEIAVPKNDTLTTGKLGRPGKNFANAVLHSVFNKEQFKESLQKQYEIEESDNGAVVGDAAADSINEMVEISQRHESACGDGSEIIAEEVQDSKDALCETAEHDSSNVASDNKEAPTKEEKKVVFSQSTEEYQQKLEAEKSILKEDVLLLHQPKVDRRWSDMGDHEYELIENPPSADDSLTQPKSELGEALRSENVTAPSDNNEPPPPSKWSDKIPFISSDAFQTQKLQSRISSKASILRKKFRRTQSTIDSDDKTSESHSRSMSIGSSCPTDRKATAGGDLAKKLKAFRIPKISKTDLTRFKLADRLKSKRASAPHSASVAENTPATVTTASADEVCNEMDQNSAAPGQTTFSSFTSHFATVPRAAARIKKSIKTKLTRSHNASEENVSLDHDKEIEQHPDDLVDQRIQLAAKVSMDDEEELLGILQAKDQLESTRIDDRGNIVLHGICDPREQREYDLCSMDSNRDIDWKEDAHMQEKMLNVALGQENYDRYGGEMDGTPHALSDEYCYKYKSNFSSDGTQSSTSYGDGRRTQTIADIDDIESTVRQLGILQNTAGIMAYERSSMYPSVADSDDHLHGSSADRDHGSAQRTHDYTNSRHSEPRGSQRHGIELTYLADEVVHAGDSQSRTDDVRPTVNTTPLAPRRLHRSATRERESVDSNTEMLKRERELSAHMEPNDTSGMHFDRSIFARCTPPRYTIEIEGSSGYATVKKDPEKPSAPARRRRKSTKSANEEVAMQPTSMQHSADSSSPQGPTRAPRRPIRRLSSSSLNGIQKPPSIAASDITQYEEIDDSDSINLDSNVASTCIQRRPLPAPPRPPRDRRLRRPFIDDRRSHSIDIGYDAQDDVTSDTSVREYVIGAEIGTQTSMDFDEPPHSEQYSYEADELNENIAMLDAAETFDDSTLENAGSLPSQQRPRMPITFLSGELLSQSPTCRMDATGMLHPHEAETAVESSANILDDLDYIPAIENVDDIQIDTDDEKVITAAIRRYQLPDLDSEVSRSFENEEPTPHVMLSSIPCRVSTNIVSTISSVQETREPIAATSDNISTAPESQVEFSNTVKPAEPAIDFNSLPAGPVVNAVPSISPQVLQEIIERVRETLPTHHQTPSSQTGQHSVNHDTKAAPPPIQESNENLQELAVDETSNAMNQEIATAPLRPPSPIDYTPSTEIPQTFYTSGAGIAEDESSAVLPQKQSMHKNRLRKHNRLCDSSSSEEERSRKHHQHHHSARAQGTSTSIIDLSEQLIRACGNALSSSLSTAGNSLLDFIRTLTKNQDDKEKDLSLVLVILIVIMSSLLMLGMHGDRSIHHHHWDYFNPPDNAGRR